MTTNSGDCRDVGEVALRAQLREVRAHLARVLERAALAATLRRALRAPSDRRRAAPWRRRRRACRRAAGRSRRAGCRPLPFCSPFNVCCSSKSQCSSIPASSTTRLSCSSPQRPRTPGRLSASTRRRVSVVQVLARRVERGDALHQLRAALDAAPLGVLDLAVHVLERFLQRREQILDRFLPRVDVGGRLAARLAQPGFGQIAETSGCWSSALRR